MAKQIAPVVKFFRSDAPKPTKSPNGVIAIKAPFPMTLKPQASVRVDFGLTCSHPLLVTHTLGETDTQIFEALKPIVINLRNPSFTDDFVYDVGTAILHAIPVLTPDFDLE